MKRQTKLAFDPQVFLANATVGTSIVNYVKNQKIFSQGDLADSIFYIQQGKVKIGVVSDRGKEAVVALLTRGDFFGEGCLAGQLVRMGTAVAMSECLIMRVEKARAVWVLHEEPTFSELVRVSFAFPQHSD